MARKGKAESGTRVESPRRLTAEERDELLAALQARFERNMHRHEGIAWADVRQKLARSSGHLWSLFQMERTGGEPDVVGIDADDEAYVFIDCSAQSPAGRRSICYDRAALDARKEHKPDDTAIDMATAMGIEILTEQQYRALQEFGEFDTKTSSWVKTPPAIRKLGGAIFCDRRYDQVFVYHNGADSYYGARGFRGALRV